MTDETNKGVATKADAEQVVLTASDAAEVAGWLRDLLRIGSDYAQGVDAESLAEIAGWIARLERAPGYCAD